jgi:hypothetical protein
MADLAPHCMRFTDGWPSRKQELRHAVTLSGMATCRREDALGILATMSEPRQLDGIEYHIEVHTQRTITPRRFHTRLEPAGRVRP